MKSSKLILSHAAVFAVGISAAVIANRGGDESSASDREAAARSARTTDASGSALTGGESPAARDRRESTRGSTGSGTPVERMGQIVRLTDPYERQRALMDLIDQLGPDQFAAVADQFREADHLGNSGDEYELLLRGWAKADPLAALEYVNAHPDARRGRETILQSWAGRDAAAAEQWALANHDGEGANPHLAAIISGIAPNDMAHATRLVATMPGSRERGDAVEAMSRALLVEGVDAALAYPETIEDPALRGTFTEEIADRLARKDVDKAAEWVASLTDGAIQNRAAEDVAEALVRKDVKQAAEWVSKLKPEAQVEAAREIIPAMSSSDIEGTARWVASLAGAPEYDRAVEAFVYSCDERAPEQSAAWIQGITDPERQMRTYYRVLGSWARKDAAAVRAWVETNNVPADIQRRFTRR